MQPAGAVAARAGGAAEAASRRWAASRSASPCCKLAQLALDKLHSADDAIAHQSVLELQPGDADAQRSGAAAGAGGEVVRPGRSPGPPRRRRPEGPPAARMRSQTPARRRDPGERVTGRRSRPRSSWSGCWSAIPTTCAGAHVAGRIFTSRSTTGRCKTTLERAAVRLARPVPMAEPPPPSVGWKASGWATRRRSRTMSGRCRPTRPTSKSPRRWRRGGPAATSAMPPPLGGSGGAHAVDGSAEAEGPAPGVRTSV